MSKNASTLNSELTVATVAQKVIVHIDSMLNREGRRACFMKSIQSFDYGH